MNTIWQPCTENYRLQTDDWVNSIARSYNKNNIINCYSANANENRKTQAVFNGCSNPDSDVTSSGVTQGGKWWRHVVSSCFFLKKTDNLLAVISSLLPSSHIVYPVFFLNSATKKIYSGITPGWCHPGWSALSPFRRSPSDATELWSTHEAGAYDCDGMTR